MDLNPSADQKAIVSSVQDVMTRESARGWGLAGHQDERAIGDDLWAQCAELGWIGLGLDEDAGGVGLGAADEVLLFREAGRFLMPGPLLGSVVAAHAAHEAGEAVTVEAIASGARRAGWRVGAHLVDAHLGDLAVSLDRDEVIVEEVGDAEPVPSVDPSVRVQRAGGLQPVVRVESRHLAMRARLLMAASLLGIAEATRDQSVEYAKDRIQFGKPIGVHQAVKHRCADELIRCWTTRAQLFFSALLLDAGRPEAELNVASAIWLALDAAKQNVAANVHNHGGIGVTAEHTAGNYVKRAQVLEQCLGDLAPVQDALLNTSNVTQAVAQ